MSFKMKKLLLYEKEDDMESGGPITTYEFNQIHSVRTLKNGEHETFRIKQSDLKKVLVVRAKKNSHGFGFCDVMILYLFLVLAVVY